MLLCMTSQLHAQTIGDHLNYIKEKEPNGQFSYNPEGGSTYTVSDKQHTLWIYFLNVDLECIALAMHPSTSGTFQAYVELFNQEWVIMDDTHWKFYRNNGTILKAYIDVVNNVGSVFYVSE